jgi:hypothetical protein
MYLLSKIANISTFDSTTNVLSFGATTEEMVHLWIVFCRSVLQQSCVMWHSSLAQENREDLEKTQKTFCKLKLKEKSLMQLNLDSLDEIRKIFCVKFAKSGIRYEKLNDLFPTNQKEHDMKTRKAEKYNINFANTERLKKGSIITMQTYLNEAKSESRKRNFG